jgi:hypothetical protein
MHACTPFTAFATVTCIGGAGLVERMPRTNEKRGGGGREGGYDANLMHFGGPAHTLLAEHRTQHGKKKRGRITYSERFNGGELLHNGFLLGEISCTNGQSSGCNDWQTDRDTHDQEDKGVVQQVVRATFGRRNLEMMEETTNPGCDNPADDQNQERRADGVHDSLEMALIFSSSNERCCATNEGHPGGVGNNGICLSTLATRSVVDNVGHVLVDRKRLSGHGRLIDGEDSIARAVLFAANLVVIFSFVFNFLASLSLKLLLEVCPAIGVIVGGNNSCISGDDLTVLDDDLDQSTRFVQTMNPA